MAILDMSKVRRDVETTVEEFCRANGWRYVSTNNGKLAMVSDEAMWKIVSRGGALELYRVDIYVIKFTMKIILFRHRLKSMIFES